MRRYALFVFHADMAAGGWNDFASAFESLEEAKSAFRATREGYVQLVDLELRRVLKQKLYRVRAPYRSDLH